jgi:hypothetical protein
MYVEFNLMILIVTSLLEETPLVLSVYMEKAETYKKIGISTLHEYIFICLQVSAVKF